MESLHHDPATTLSCSTPGEVSISVVESPTRHHADAVQFIVPMHSSNHTAREIVAIPIIDAEADYPSPFPTPNPPPVHVQQFHIHQGKLYLLYVGVIVVMYPSLTQMAQLKFQNNQPSPFESHSVFSYMAVVAYIIAVPTSVNLFSMKPYIENISRRNFIYMILKITLCFSGILAPLSLVLLILIPKEFNWIGYVIVYVLFVIVIAFNFDDVKELLGKNDGTNLGSVDQRDITNLGVDQLDDLSPHSTIPIISE